ncbi:MAG: 30S ribosomal protein S6 [bacterium]|nr:30S ribosomal protein S6 [bacterium]
MNKYELTVILDGKTTPAKKKTFQELLEKLIKITKGKIVKLDEWGVRDLAYNINKSATGLYLHYNLELESGEVKGLETKLGQEDLVLRHLLIRKD